MLGAHGIVGRMRYVVLWFCVTHIIQTMWPYPYVILLIMGVITLSSMHHQSVLPSPTTIPFSGSITDLEFNLPGYLWQIANCLCTSGYSLYLRGVMDQMASYTDDARPLSELSMVYFNNLLSLPLLLLLMLYNGEAMHVLHEPSLHNPYFQAAAVTSGIVSFGISFASLWFLSSSTPTTYSLVGSLNKVPIAVLSMFMFEDKNLTNIKNLASVALGLAAGVVFVHAKSGGKK